MLWFQSAARRRLLRARRVDVSFARRCPSYWAVGELAAAPLTEICRTQTGSRQRTAAQHARLLEAQDYVGPKAFRLGSLAAEREAERPLSAKF